MHYDALVVGGSFAGLSAAMPEQRGCAIDAGPLGPVVRTDAAKMTTVPGVYAAGDVAQRWSNATLASADGVLAGAALHRALVWAP
ncbi:hypothetical protein OOT46_23220 [Aquabacterium sp. A7-Y]|uniref:hypothetical protein n=1 Tax=Aquabacterium sp. A7-Y TaxID=1349605 RepID=UPI00223E2F98|nr:hypothetical protein [Aquabacterium sp. A7-Y]MCW7540734.1 hypothetical protein [Aquabacterium sp. A7-Y]